MKSIIFLLAGICLGAVLNAQSVYRGKGKINLVGDSTVEGIIWFKPVRAGEVLHRIDSVNDKWRVYRPKQVKDFVIDSLVFEPRIPKGGELAIDPNPVFMEVVVKTKTGLNMYIGHYQETPVRKESLTFYVSVPDNTEETYDLNAFKFIPKFDDKASKIVEACPALAEKIKKKEKGYFYNLMNQQKAPDIWADIILEYKKCIGE